MWKKYDPNPVPGGRRGDCVIRALTIATNQTWDTVYWDLCIKGFYAGNWGNANDIWREYLREHEYRQYIVPNTCPSCYTVSDFCRDHPSGIYVLCTGAGAGDHVIAVMDGDYYDTWDSGKEIPVFYFRRA